jgi:hypothetical protein
MNQRKRLLLAIATGDNDDINHGRKKRKAKKHPKKVWVRNWLNRRLEGKGILKMLKEELLIEDPYAYKKKFAYGQ